VFVVIVVGAVTGNDLAFAAGTPLDITAENIELTLYHRTVVQGCFPAPQSSDSSPY
jgi:hypothetical protein